MSLSLTEKQSAAFEMYCVDATLNDKRYIELEKNQCGRWRTRSGLIGPSIAEDARASRHGACTDQDNDSDSDKTDSLRETEHGVLRSTLDQRPAWRAGLNLFAAILFPRT